MDKQKEAQLRAIKRSRERTGMAMMPSGHVFGADKKALHKKSRRQSLREIKEYDEA